MSTHLSFLGAAQNVTGSRYLLEVDDTKILVDCGLYQERNLTGRNWEPFLIDPKTIDVMVLTHAHLDHCGLIPKLVKDGFKGRIVCTSASEGIANIVMLDSAKIQMEDVKYKIKRHKREGRKSKREIVPLYTIEDALDACELFDSTFYNKPVQLAEGIEVTFFDAGHVPRLSHGQNRHQSQQRKKDGFILRRFRPLGPTDPARPHNTRSRRLRRHGINLRRPQSSRS